AQRERARRSMPTPRHPVTVEHPTVERATPRRRPAATATSQSARSVSTVEPGRQRSTLEVVLLATWRVAKKRWLVL
ncbi:MAG: hypothetical protein ACRDZY_05395, partial [Acidimicrobiales bacterium]